MMEMRMKEEREKQAMKEILEAKDIELQQLQEENKLLMEENRRQDYQMQANRRATLVQRERVTTVGWRRDLDLGHYTNERNFGNNSDPWSSSSSRTEESIADRMESIANRIL